MATTPTEGSGTASRWRVVAAVAMVVLGIVGGVVALAGDADDHPAVPSTASVLAAGGGAATTPSAPEPPMTDPAPAPTTGTLEIRVAPVGDGSSLQVWVESADGAEVLDQHEVTGPIVLELAPGRYEVFIQRTGPSSGPDEDGVELGGGSTVSRDPVEVIAGRTTTVACSICAPM